MRRRGSREGRGTRYGTVLGTVAMEAAVFMERTSRTKRRPRQKALRRPRSPIAAGDLAEDASIDDGTTRHAASSPVHSASPVSGMRAPLTHHHRVACARVTL